MDYAATKAAIVNITKSLATELAPKGIRVNTVAPGPIWTPLIPATMPAENTEEFSSKNPLDRAGQPAEVAPAFVFLASQEASFNHWRPDRRHRRHDPALRCGTGGRPSHSVTPPVHQVTDGHPGSAEGVFSPVQRR